jgi:hypothetical protein
MTALKGLDRILKLKPHSHLNVNRLELPLVRVGRIEKRKAKIQKNLLNKKAQLH